MLESVATGQTAAPGQAVAEGNAARGKQLFEKKTCYYCHGSAAQGGRDGARIAVTAMSAPAFIRYVRKPGGAMPAFTEKILSDQELTDIYVHLKSPSGGTRAERDSAPESVVGKVAPREPGQNRSSA
jgi:mono/diheme cytochrome c family protein